MATKAEVTKFREMLEKFNPSGLRVLFHKEKGIVRVELTSIDRIPAPVMMAGKVSSADGKIIIVIPVGKLATLMRPTAVPLSNDGHLPGVYKHRQMEIDGQLVNTEYVPLDMVGVPYDGAFTLDSVSAGGKKRRVAGTVAWESGRDGKF